MTSHKPGEVLATDDQILARVRECYETDQTLDAGGVTTDTAAAGLPIADSTTKDRLRDLAERGVLERDWGFEDGQQRIGYRPATDRSVALRDGETRDDTAHASDIVSQQLAEADDDLRDELEERHEIRADGGLAPCQMCDNGLADHFPAVDGDDLELCSSCYSLLEESGRLGDCTEVSA